MKSVLVVEDNRLLVGMLQQLLEDEYDVHVALNGKLGVAAAQEHRPHVILMDLTMPVMDGWTAIKAIRADATTRRIPIIALSARIDPGDVARAMDAGADAHLSKPIDEAALRATIERLLERAPVASGVRLTRDEVRALVDSAKADAAKKDGAGEGSR